MRPLDPTKDRMALEIDQQLRAFLKRGGKIEELPAPGSGHTLTHTYSLRNNDAATAIKSGVKP
jgi:hypothetical protein